MSEQSITLPGGVVVTMRSPVAHNRFWLKGQYYEANMLAHIRESYHGGTFIDCGACIGNHTLYFAAFCAEQVIAIEPVQRNMDYLRENLRLSDLRAKVTTVLLALGSKSGMGAMTHPEGKDYVGVDRYFLVDGNETGITTLDEITKLAQYPVTLVKLDIEGSELKALQGATRLLQEQAPVLFVEVQRARKSELELITRFLKSFGYVRGKRFNSTPTYKFYTSRKV